MSIHRWIVVLVLVLVLMVVVVVVMLVELVQLDEMMRRGKCDDVHQMTVGNDVCQLINRSSGSFVWPSAPTAVFGVTTITAAVYCSHLSFEWRDLASSKNPVPVIQPPTHLLFEHKPIK